MSAPVDAVVMASAAPKERPILFSGPMVRAILEGRKTQTRRIVKPQPKWVYGETVPVKTDWADPRGAIESPYGYIGDRLRISEDVTVTAIEGRRYQMHYAADDSVITRFATPDLYAKIKAYKRPRLRGVNLPAAYARDVRLEITGVRVERLQDISEANCWLEGIEEVMHDFDDQYQYLMAKRLGCCIEDAKPLFALLWESINGDGSWAANPWVWVLEFKRLG